MPLLNIIIPTYNRKRLLEECLNSILSQTFTDYKIIVVVDGSTDGTINMLEESFKGLEVIRGNGDWWWTKSVNKGIEAAFKYNPDNILLLNDDVVLPPEYLNNVMKAANENPGCLLGSSIKDIRTGKYTYIGTNLDWRKVRYKNLITLYDLEKLSEYIPVNHLPGRGLLIPIQVFSKLGLFDTRTFPQQKADADFSLRAINAGYNLVVATNAYLFSHVDEGPDKVYESNYSIANFFKRLYEKKSKQNIYYTLRFNIRHCPKRWLLSYSLINVSAIIIGYLKRWLVSEDL